MAEQYLTLLQLNELFQRLTMDILGLDQANKNSAYLVRIQYPRGGVPAFKIYEDIAFLHVDELDDSYNRQRELEYINIGAGDTLNQRQFFTRVLRVNWTFYGPSAYEYATNVRDGMFYQEFRDTLAKNEIYVIPEIISPKIIHEPFQGQWWDRSDVSIEFNEHLIREHVINSVGSVDIVLTDDGITNHTKTIS